MVEWRIRERSSCYILSGHPLELRISHIILPPQTNVGYDSDHMLYLRKHWWWWQRLYLALLHTERSSCYIWEAVSHLVTLRCRAPNFNYSILKNVFSFVDTKVRIKFDISKFFLIFFSNIFEVGFSLTYGSGSRHTSITQPILLWPRMDSNHRPTH